MTKSTDLVPLSPEEYPALDPKNRTLALMRENLGNEPITAADLVRVRVPPGGGTTWTVASADGDQPADKLAGVIIYTTRRRAFWPSPDPTGDPPSCVSADCIGGRGDPHCNCSRLDDGRWNCSQCQQNEFGSAKNGRGKACKEARILLLLQAGSPLPMVLVVPPGSLRSVRGYLGQLAQAGFRYCEVVTDLTLEQAVNKDGIKFARIGARKTAVLDDKARKQVAAFAKDYAEALSSFQVEGTDVNGGTQEV